MKSRQVQKYCKALNFTELTALYYILSGTLITCTQPPFCIEELNGTFTVTCTRSLDLMIKTMISITSVDGTAVGEGKESHTIYIQ